MLEVRTLPLEQVRNPQRNPQAIHLQCLRGLGNVVTELAASRKEGSNQGRLRPTLEEVIDVGSG